MKKIIPFAIIMLCSCGYKSVATGQSLNGSSYCKGKGVPRLIVSEKLNEMSLAFRLNAMGVINHNDNYRGLSGGINYSVDDKELSYRDFKLDASMKIDSQLKYEYANSFSMNGNVILLSYSDKSSAEKQESGPEKENGPEKESAPKTTLDEIIKEFSKDSTKSLYSFIFLVISTVWGILLLSSSESKVKSERATSLLNKASLVLDRIKAKPNASVNLGDIKEFLHYIESAKQALDNVTLQEYFLDVKHYSQLIIVNSVPWDVYAELKYMYWLSKAINNSHIRTGGIEKLKKEYKLLRKDLIKLPSKSTKFSYLVIRAVLIFSCICFAFFFFYFVILG